MHYKKNEKLSELIENKRVVFVGPAQYLVGKKMGSIINGFDTVCRVKYMAPGNFTTDYGNRTDIMFYNCNSASLKQMEQHFEEYPGFSKRLKLVVCPIIKVLGPEKWKEWGSNYVSKVVENFSSINTHKTDFHWIGMDNYRYLYDLMGCLEPNTGPLSMLMILEHNPKELFVTGFTFYANKNDTYFDKYATKAPNWSGRSGHPQPEQIEFFRKYILAQGIKIDAYLNNLLKFKHNNIQKF
jgi:hypothetical protein